MPFTPTHIVAVVPLAAAFRWMPLSALAIGSMVPDLPMFLPIVDYAQTHSPIGVFTTCLPLGMAAFILFQYVLKVPLLSLLPVWIQQRLTGHTQPLLLPSFRFFVFVAVSIVAGAATHIIWDAFTHQGRWGTQILPFLNDEFTIAGRTLPGFKLFQYGSTFVGLPLLAVLSLTILIRAIPAPNSDLSELNWMAKAPVAAVFVLRPCLVFAIVFRTDATIYQKVGTTIKASGVVLMVGVFAYSILFHVLTYGDTARNK